jgi:hypothetical protein
MPPASRQMFRQSGLDRALFVSMLMQIMERETGFEPATLSLEG